MPATCRECGSTNIEYDGARGDAACMTCGIVLEENAIVSDVTFAETASGQSMMVGQFVPQSGPHFVTPGFYGAKDSRDVTLVNGRKKISQVAAALDLYPNHVDQAQRLFQLAVEHNFIQGRKTQNVVAACLYIVCRRDKTAHMLIDFSDVLQTNVYVLGHTFLKLRHLLSLTLPIIDPSLYIHRFAASLEFGDKKHVVAMTALRLVQRMKRDWILCGRRPSGICGAALLIAARLHGFRRTQKEIVDVVRICDMTLKKRLSEFQDTPSSNLTPAEFHQLDFSADMTTYEKGGCDPPAFARSQRQAAAARGELKLKDKKKSKKDKKKKKKKKKKKEKNKKNKEGKGKGTAESSNDDDDDDDEGEEEGGESSGTTPATAAAGVHGGGVDVDEAELDENDALGTFSVSLTPRTQAAQDVGVFGDLVFYIHSTKSVPTTELREKLTAAGARVVDTLSDEVTNVVAVEESEVDVTNREDVSIVDDSWVVSTLESAGVAGPATTTTTTTTTATTTTTSTAGPSNETADAPSNGGANAFPLVITSRPNTQPVGSLSAVPVPVPLSETTTASSVSATAAPSVVAVAVGAATEAESGKHKKKKKKEKKSKSSAEKSKSKKKKSKSGSKSKKSKKKKNRKRKREPVVELRGALAPLSTHPNAGHIDEQNVIRGGQTMDFIPQKAPGEDDPLSDIDDSELEGYFLNDEESKMKESIWNQLNADYLRDQAEKQRKLEEDRAAGIEPKQPKRKKRKKNTSGGGARPSNPREALEQQMINSRIDPQRYSALIQQFESSSAKTSLVASVASDLSKNKQNTQLGGESGGVGAGPSAVPVAVPTAVRAEDDDDFDDDFGGAAYQPPGGEENLDAASLFQHGGSDDEY